MDLPASRSPAPMARRWILAGVVGGLLAAVVLAVLLATRPWAHDLDRESLRRGCLGSCRSRFEHTAAAAGLPAEAGAKAEQYCQCYCQGFDERLSPAQAARMGRLGPEGTGQDPALLQELEAVGAGAKRACLDRIFPASAR